MIVGSPALYGQMVALESDAAGAGVGNYNYVQFFGAGAPSARQLILSGYAYHDDAGANHNVTWGWIDSVNSTEFWQTETLRAQNVRHWLHSANGDPDDPSVWLNPYLQIKSHCYLQARGHGIPADKKLYGRILVLEAAEIR